MDTLNGLYPKYMNAYEERKIPHTLGGFDMAGIPLFDHKHIGGVGHSYHPIVIIQYGLGAYNLYLEGDEVLKEECIKMANWLCTNFVSHPSGFYYWPYQFDLKAHHILAPWYSGMAQGQSLSLLSRAHKLTGDSKYLEIANQVIPSLTQELSVGGCSTFEKKGKFIQELATEPPTYILNGALYAIIGLIEFDQNKGIYTALIKELLQVVDENIHQYDLGFWSRYSLGYRFNLADDYYHEIHIKQLTWLLDRYDLDQVAVVRDKFVDYQNKSGIVTKLKRKMALNFNRLIRWTMPASFIFKGVKIV